MHTWASSSHGPASDGAPGTVSPSVIVILSPPKVTVASRSVVRSTTGLRARRATRTRAVESARFASTRPPIISASPEASSPAGIETSGIRCGTDEHETLLARLVTPVIKYWTCKRAPQHAAEALECLGGAGYVEESDLPRLFRQSPVNGVWEGSGNVICLDVLRAAAREPRTLEAYFDEVGLAGGADRRLDQAAASLRAEIGDQDGAEWRARRLVERMAVVFQASLLVRHAPAAVADAFCASRLDRDAGLAFGTLPRGVGAASIVERARP